MTTEYVFSAFAIFNELLSLRPQGVHVGHPINPVLAPPGTQTHSQLSSAYTISTTIWLGCSPDS